jgi:hypothetical protein
VLIYTPLSLNPENGPYHAEWKVASGNFRLDWSEGQIYTKNPDETLIDKMVAIASQLNANVQGDDGERYTGGSEPPQEPKVTFSDRIAGWLSRIRPQKQINIEHEPLSFDVGDKVKDIFGNIHTVIEINPNANHGMGAIRTRRDDGTKHSRALVARGFEPIDKRKAA